MNSSHIIRVFILIAICLEGYHAGAQNIAKVYMPNIQTAQLFPYGNQEGLPMYNLNGGGQLELEFDDLDGGVKNYYYSYVLCDYNWQPVDLNPFDYMKGFTQNRISTYRYSSIALVHYTHYQAFFPDRNSVPTKSGNYLLKVYLDGDTSKLAFTKQMLVVEQRGTISANILQPFTPDKFSTHQKIKFTATFKGLNSFSAAQQVKVVILQNNRWDVSQRDIAPTFVRGDVLDFSAENIANFPAGKEWRWLDIRNFSLESDRVDHQVRTKTSTDIFLKTDMDRTGQRYIFFSDLNGSYVITNYERLNPFWQSDYATVHFTFARPDGTEYPNKDIYLAGAFTGFRLDDEWKMKYNPETLKYECNTFMKQGYYNYTYIAVDKNDPTQRVDLEGNYWETENKYTILVYYKSFTDRNEQLIGMTILNSRIDKASLSF